MSIALALVASAVLIAVTGGPWQKVLSAILDGSFRNPGRWGGTLAEAVPLLLVALGAIVSTRAGLVNIGQEGQVAIGAALATFVATRNSGPFALVAVLIGGFVGGALWAGIAALLKYWRKVPEVISTLLLVFIASQLTGYLLTRTFLLLDPDPNKPNRVQTSAQVDPSTRIGQIRIFGNEFPWSVPAVLCLAAMVGVALQRSVWGFRLNVLGRNARTAQRTGVSVVRAGATALMIGGAMAGLAGAVMLAGGTANYRYTPGFANNVGWEGLLVALVAAQPAARVHSGGVGVRRAAHGIRLPGGDRGRAVDRRRGSRAVGVGAARATGRRRHPPASRLGRGTIANGAIRRSGGTGSRGRAGVIATMIASVFTVLGDVFGSEAMYNSAIRFAIVLAFAATGEWVAERAGTLNISIEAMMIGGAFTAGVTFAQITSHSPSTSPAMAMAVGLVAATTAGVVVSLVQANLSHRLSIDQFVVGLTLNLFVLGLALFLDSRWEAVTSVAKPTRVPLLSDIPLVGDALFGQPWPMYLIVPVVPFAWWLVFHTRWGLEVRSVGDNPQAADVSGISVNRRRRQAIMFAGLASGSRWGSAGAGTDLDLGLRDGARGAEGHHRHRRRHLRRMDAARHDHRMPAVRLLLRLAADAPRARPPHQRPVGRQPSRTSWRWRSRPCSPPAAASPARWRSPSSAA